MSEYAVPILPSRDLRETLEFYVRLGFEPSGGDFEAWKYLIIRRGSLELHFFDWPDVDPLTTSAMCYLHVRNADELHAEWAAIGVPTDSATGSRLTSPEDTPYGMREFALVDRSGNLLRVGSR